MLNLPISRDGFFWAFSIASQIHRVPLSSALIMQKYQPPFTLGSFREAAEECGFKVRQKAVPNSQLAKLPLPCLVTLIPAVEEVSSVINGDEAVAQHNTREYQIALLQSIDEESAVLAEACSKSTTTLNRQVFEKRFAGEALIVTLLTTESDDMARAEKKSKSTGSKKGSGKIGMAWFMPLKSIFRSAR